MLRLVCDSQWQLLSWPTGGSDDASASDETWEFLLVLNVVHNTHAWFLLRLQGGRKWRCAFKSVLGSLATYLTPEYILAYSTNIPLRLQIAQ